MIIKISRYFLLVIIIAVCAHFIPKLYWMKFEKSVRTPFISYSPIIHDFIISANVSGSKLASEVIIKDTKGNVYTREENDSLLPFMNFRQLASLNKMPVSIDGVDISLDAVRMNNFTFRLTPDAIDFKPISLYSLLESKSGRVKLEMPNNFFRITDRMEFVDGLTNKIDEEKSKIFSDYVLKKGFKFPAKIIAGNPTTRKPFDEGYFVLDANNNLFHIKMVKGKPFCENTNIPKDLDIVNITAMEMNLREFYAYIVTKDNQIYLLSYNNYKLIKLPVKNYNYKTDKFFIIGDLLYRTTSVFHNNYVEIFVADRNYKLVDHYTQGWQDKYETTAGMISTYIFPFSINYLDADSSWYDLYLKFSDLRSLIVNFFIALIAIGVIKYRKQNLSNSLIDIVLVLFTGIYGLIAVMSIKNIE